MSLRSVDSADPAVQRDASRLAKVVDDSTEVGRMVHSLLSDIGRGEQIVVLRADEEVTPAEAACMIGVTRQFVDRLCEDGVLPYRRLPSSRHRRIRVADVVAVIEERDRLRHGHAALVDALTEAGLATD